LNKLKSPTQHMALALLNVI